MGTRAVQKCAQRSCMSLLSVCLRSTIGVPPVHGFQVAHLNPDAVDREDPHTVQPDRVGAVGRARGEHALLCSRRVAAGMYAQDVAPGVVEPREHDYLVAGVETFQALENRGREARPRVRRPSSPCFGTDARSASGDSTVPIWVSSKRGSSTLAPPRSAPVLVSEEPSRHCGGLHRGASESDVDSPKCENSAGDANAMISLTRSPSRARTSIEVGR